MNNAYLLIGGNTGDRSENLNNAIVHIEKECGIIEKKSSVYRTAAWGYTEQPDFYNQCLLLQTNDDPHVLMQKLLEIEFSLGRIRNERMGPRTIDLDILLFNDLIVHTEDLEIPHPRLHLRRFALLPLAEIAPKLVHPSLQKTITQLLKDCPDQLDVHKI